MITPPSQAVTREASERLAGLAIPQGALGRLGDLGVWLSAAQGQVPPAPLENIRAVVFAGDHGVASAGVSAYGSEITPMMVRAFAAGVAGVSVLARQHQVSLRVLDIGVDADLSDLGPEITAHKVCSGSGSIDREDALTSEQLRASLDAGRKVADEEIDAGAQLLISGDMGIGNTTIATALIAASLSLPAADLVGRGTGIDDEALAHKTAVIETAIDRVGDRVADPAATLLALGSADIAVSAAFMARAAERGIPVLLDGVISVSAALMADRLAPGSAAWFIGGHRSTEPAQSNALEKLGVTPLIDVGMRLGEGSGAMAAVPLVRSAALLLGEIALLSELV